MIFMTVSENDTFYFFLVSLDICEVGNYHIDTEHFTVRECHSAVEQEHIVVTFKQGHIFSDLIKTAQKRDFYSMVGLFGIISFILEFIFFEGAFGTFSILRRTRQLQFLSVRLFFDQSLTAVFGRKASAFSALGHISPIKFR